MQRLNWVCSRFLLLLLLFGVSISGLGADKNKTGTLLLVGEVLSFKQRAVWKRIFQLAGSEAADVVVIPAANARAKLYGSFAQRALSRYGPFVELLPLAETVSDRTGTWGKCSVFCRRCATTSG
ncbi:MAG: hypothetical protein GWN80_02285 [Gammaproteobacteria bacterium]|nr:hypothetical protein [Gammaproteobacteria bacterium]